MLSVTVRTYRRVLFPFRHGHAVHAAFVRLLDVFVALPARIADVAPIEFGVTARGLVQVVRAMTIRAHGRGADAALQESLAVNTFLVRGDRGRLMEVEISHS